MMFQLVASMIVVWAPFLQGPSSQSSTALKAPAYDKAGPYVLTPNLSLAKRSLLQATIRDWLWQHWQAHRQGQLIVDEYTNSAGESHSTYVLEQDSSGTWQMTIKMRASIRDPWYPDQKYDQHTELHAYLVERIAVSPNTVGKGASLPSDATVDPVAYRLVLKDNAKNRLYDF